MTSHPINILIADDDPDDVELLQSALSESYPQLEVKVASDGQDLLWMLETGAKPGVIVLDLNMPIKSGKECLEEIRSRFDYNDVPIVMYSTSSQAEEINYCLRNGANNYFIKPSSYSGIQNVVRKIYQNYIQAVSV